MMCQSAQHVFPGSWLLAAVGYIPVLLLSCQLSSDLPSLGVSFRIRSCTVRYKTPQLLPLTFTCLPASASFPSVYRRTHSTFRRILPAARNSPPFKSIPLFTAFHPPRCPVYIPITSRHTLISGREATPQFFTLNSSFFT